MRIPVRRRPPWYRRLSVRLAGILALTLVAFDFLAPHVYEFVFERFGMPDGVLVVDGDDAEKTADAFAFHSHHDHLEIAELLLEGATKDAAGRWRPTPAGIAAATAELAPSKERFLWLDRDLVVQVGSDELPWQPGQTWSPEACGHPPASEWGTSHEFPVHREGALAGWLVLFFSSPSATIAFGSSFDDPTLWMNGEGETGEAELPEEVRQLARRVRILAEAVSWGSTFLIAILLSVAISRLVTVRLTRLATMVGQPVQDAPGTLRVRGGDEISMLAQALDESRRQVRELVQALDERDVRRREWIAQVSHDLRTPLTALIACLERAAPVLARLRGQGAPEEMAGILAVAVQDAERVRVLADDLLEVARLDAHAELHLEPVLPGELVERATQGLAPLGAQRGVDVRASTPALLPTATADGSRLLRVLENLLRNAIQNARTEVVVAVLPGVNEVRFEVRDDGPGFPGEAGPVDLGAVSATRPPGDSTSAGLGLTVARRIIDAHGGTLGATNRSPGATVWFTIPAAADPDVED